MTKADKKKKTIRKPLVTPLMPRESHYIEDENVEKKSQSHKCFANENFFLFLMLI